MPASQTSTLDRVVHTGWFALRFKDPTLPVWIGAALLLIFLMLLPLGAIFRSSVWGDTGFTFTRYVEVFTNEQFLKAIWNTLNPLTMPCIRRTRGLVTPQRPAKAW